MACIENIEPPNADSEMEEGEIVDDVDYLSDISSEEEFLLRQRLQVLENYNNVLERKKAKNSFGSGVRKQDALLQDLSEFSASDLEDNIATVKAKANTIVFKKSVKELKHIKSHKHKKRKVEQKVKDKKKVHYRKRLEVKVISESSEESEDEYRNKRRKLANAVAFHRDTNDKTSLQQRLNKMLCKTKIPEINKPTITVTEDKQTEMPKLNINLPVVTKLNNIPTVTIEVQATEEKSLPENASELIDLSSDEGVNAKVDENIASNKQSVDLVDAVTKVNCNDPCKQDLKADSDEDLELLRQHALKTKTSKTKVDPIDKTVVSTFSPKPTSEDEDSDTAELRLICLKSALLKKAIEMKQKQKLQKRLSQSSNLQDDFIVERDELMDQIHSENNTDIESVDMDIGSDADDKGKDVSNENSKVTTKQDVVCDHNENIEKDTQKPNMRKEDELEEDEDLLRAKLLTSLSKNLPHLVDPSALNTVEDEKDRKSEKEIAKENATVSKVKIPENRIVINLNESDSDGEEHEATKNLTKMHMKLSEQVDFQEKLDIFLKSTRMEVEKSKVPDVVQEPLTPKTKEKFVAKSLNHLPKTEQIEYRNLVKRMAELEKIKQARQTSMNLVNQVPIKDTLKPRNVTVDPAKFVTINQIEQQIAMSRKKIAEESAIMLKLKEQATKLSQKYKIVATELKNIATAITLNKKEQRSAQNRLSKIRIQHQRLLNSSTAKHSKTNGNLAVNNPINRDLATTKLQKENNPKNDDYKNSSILKTVKVSVANQGDSVSNNARLSVQVDVVSNKKIVKLPNEKSSTRVVEIQKNCAVNNKTTNLGDTVSNNERLSVHADVVNNNKKSVNEKSSTSAVEIQKDLHKQDKLDDLKEGDTDIPVVEKGEGKMCEERTASETRVETRKELDEYKSPLQALDSANWEADPNAILCPFEVGGHCKDPDCKFLHPKVPH